jgi:hypothetical protein
VIADFVTLYLLPSRKFYKSAKYEELEDTTVNQSGESKPLLSEKHELKLK